MLLLLAGGVYFFAKPTDEDARVAAALARAEQAAAQSADPADDRDTALVQKLLAAKELSEAQTNVLIFAAGRRYERRKVALAEAEKAIQAGKSPAASLELLRHDVDLARRVCDVAESLGRSHEQVASADAQLEWILAGRAGLGWGLTDHFTGSREFTEADLKDVQKAFETQYGRVLPISAHGDTASHRALGFDHSGRVDVAVSPLQPEGAWLRRYLTSKGITFFAFSSAVRGKATGAHIHIGPPSGRVGAVSAHSGASVPAAQ
jgi:hypothetical protein